MGRGHPMSLATCLTDRIRAHIDKVFVEQHRLNLPKPVPRNFDVSLFGKPFAGLFGLVKHPSERSGIEMALVEGNPAFFYNASDNARLGRTGADRANTPLLRSAIR